MRPTRQTTIRGHLVEEFRWHDCPICYVDARRVSGAFDQLVANFRVAGQVLQGNLEEKPGSRTTFPLGAEAPTVTYGTARNDKQPDAQ